MCSLAYLSRLRISLQTRGGGSICNHRVFLNQVQGNAALTPYFHQHSYYLTPNWGWVTGGTHSKIGVYGDPLYLLLEQLLAHNIAILTQNKVAMLLSICR